MWKLSAGNLPGGARVFYLLLALLVPAFSLPLFFFLAGENRNIALGARYEAQLAILRITDGLRRGETTENTVMDSVKSFGFYGIDGLPIQKAGDAPKIIDNSSFPAGTSSVFSEHGGGRYSLLIRMEPLRERGMGGMGMGLPRGPRPQVYQNPNPPPIPNDPLAGGMMGWRSSQIRYFYVEIVSDEFGDRQTSLAVSGIAFMALLAGLLAIIGYVLKKSERYRERLNDQEHLVRLGEAARLLSHEIKNPLAAIRLRTDIVRRFTSPEGLEDLEIIREETDRLRGLTDRIGEFLRDPPGIPEVLDLEVVLPGLCSAHVPPVTFGRVGSGECRVLFDPARLRSIFDNVVTNAFESGSPEVSVRLETEAKRVIIRVLDQGPGITDDVAGRLFEPFFTTKGTGSGIGLATSKRFVEAMGGTIVLANRIEGGAEIRITLERREP